jgi:DNA (cytosine-5)-methyltransferase 1
VFVVSVFDPATAARCPDPLLPVEEGVRRDTAQGATARQGAASEVAGGAGGGGDIANTISASLYHHGTVVNQDANNGHVIVEPFTASRFAEYTEGVGTLRANGGDLAGGSETLLTVIPIQDGREMHKNQNGLGIGEAGAPAYTLDQTGAQSIAIGIQGNVIGRQDHNGPAGKGHTEEGDPMFTLNATDIHAVAYNKVIRSGARDAQGTLPPEVWAQQEISPTITSFDQGEVRATTIITEPIAFSHTQGLSAQPSEEAFPRLRREGSGMAVATPLSVRMREGKPGRGKGPLISEDKSLTLGCANDQTVLTPTMTVRRLTPLECERLMGWPDNWTAGQSDTHRYKQCGNGVASPVAEWIGRQLINL